MTGNAMLCRCGEHLRSPGKPLCWECIDEALHRDPPQMQKNIARHVTYVVYMVNKKYVGAYVGRGFTTRFKEYPE